MTNSNMDVNLDAPLPVNFVRWTAALFAVTIATALPFIPLLMPVIKFLSGRLTSQAVTSPELYALPWEIGAAVWAAPFAMWLATKQVKKRPVSRLILSLWIIVLGLMGLYGITAYILSNARSGEGAGIFFLFVQIPAILAITAYVVGCGFALYTLIKSYTRALVGEETVPAAKGAYSARAAMWLTSASALHLALKFSSGPLVLAVVAGLCGAWLAAGAIRQGRNTRQILLTLFISLACAVSAAALQSHHWTHERRSLERLEALPLCEEFGEQVCRSDCRGGLNCSFVKKNVFVNEVSSIPGVLRASGYNTSNGMEIYILAEDGAGSPPQLLDVVRRRLDQVDCRASEDTLERMPVHLVPVRRRPLDVEAVITLAPGADRNDVRERVMRAIRESFKVKPRSFGPIDGRRDKEMRAKEAHASICENYGDRYCFPSPCLEKTSGIKEVSYYFNRSCEGKFFQVPPPCLEWEPGQLPVPGEIKVTFEN